MGMYDDVLLKDVECQHCKKTVKEFNCQTKDFECTLDQLNQWDDVRELKQSWIMCDGSLGRKKGRWDEIQNWISDAETPERIKKSLRKIEKDDCEILSNDEIKKKYGDRSKYDLKFWEDSWCVYKYVGLFPNNWSDIESYKFNCYGNCPECKEWNEFTATILNYLFIGVVP